MWDGKLYQFCYLPFDLASAPRIFTKILKPPLSVLRDMGHQSSAYIGDIWMISKIYKETLTNVSNTSVLFEKLGFTINYKKSSMTPNTKIEHLGFINDSEKMTVSLLLQKK